MLRAYVTKREHPTSPKVHYSEGSLVRRFRVRVKVRVRVRVGVKVRLRVRVRVRVRVGG